MRPSRHNLNTRLPSTSSRSGPMSVVWASNESWKITDKRSWNLNSWKLKTPLRKSHATSKIIDSNLRWKKKTSHSTWFTANEVRLPRRERSSFTSSPRCSDKPRRNSSKSYFLRSQKCLESAKEKPKSSSQFCKMSWGAAIFYGLAKRSSRSLTGLACRKRKSISGGGIRLASASNAWKLTTSFLRPTKKVVTAPSLRTNSRSSKLPKILMNKRQSRLIYTISNLKPNSQAIQINLNHSNSNPHHTMVNRSFKLQFRQNRLKEKRLNQKIS